MRNRLIGVVILCFVSLIMKEIGAQQSESPNADRNQQALTVLSSVLGAMGGGTIWAAVSDATVSGGCQSSDVQSANTAASSPFRWIIAQDQFRYENGVESAAYVMLSGHGKPQMVFPSKTQTLPYEAEKLERPFHLPGLVLQSELSNSNYLIEIINDKGAAGNNSTHIRVTHRQSHVLQPGTRQDWWVDTITLLPLKVTFKLPGQAVESYMDVTYSFSAWTSQASGVLIPQQILITNEFGGESQVCTVSHLQINTQPAASLFDVR